MTIKKIHSERTRAVLPTLNDRASGVLLHLSSLPGSGPIGDLGQAAHIELAAVAEAEAIDL